MTAHTRLMALALTGAFMTSLVLAQGGPPPAPQQNPPGGQDPAQPAGGRGAGRGAGQAGAAGQGRGGGQRRGGFTQYTREIAPQDVLVRGKSLYEAHCASCHASDLRGGPNGTNLLRSGVALTDQHGELVAMAVAKHTPALTLVAADTTAIAEYIHSVHATMGSQGSPPGRNPTGIDLNILVGDPKEGEAYFKAACSGCHSVTGDLKGIGSKYPEPRQLQNAWVAGSSGLGRGRGGGGVGNQATVTMADGSKLEGRLMRKDDWLVILMLPDGTRKSMARTPTMKIDVKDPNEAHKKMVLELDDPLNKKMHDVTAYLWSIK